MKNEDKTFTIETKPKRSVANKFGRIIGYVLVAAVTVAVLTAVAALIVFLVRSMF
mgnify:CR=1 FL=1